MREVGSGLPVVLAVVALAAGGCGDGDGSAREAATAETMAANTEPSTRGVAKLIGTVGSRNERDAHEIKLTTEDGTEVTTTLAPGEYLLELDDLSTIHNFHLGGPRAAVDVATDVAGTGKKTVVVVFHDWESYSYVCDVHPATMNVTFSIHGRIRTRK